MESEIIEFLSDYSLEYRWMEGKLLVWIPHYLIEKFYQIYKFWILEESRKFKACIEENYICVDILEVFGEYRHKFESVGIRKNDSSVGDLHVIGKTIGRCG